MNPERKKWYFPILFLLPVVAVFLYILYFGVNVPFGDQWDIMPPLLEKYTFQQLTFNDFFALHNEHRIFFPRLFMLGSAVLTRYNTVVEMLLIAFLLSVSLWILISQIKRQFDWHDDYLWFFPIPFLVFSLKQWETLLFGVQITYILLYCFVLLTFFLIGRVAASKRGWFWLTVAAFSATVATFSFFSGLFVWPVALLQMIIILPSTPRKKLMTAFWIVVSALEWLFYFLGFHFSTRISDPVQVLLHPKEFIRFTISCLGNSLIEHLKLAPLAGLGIVILVMLAILMTLAYRRFRENIFWYSLILYSLITVFSISLGRMGAGEIGAFAPRYTTFTILILLSLYAIFMDLREKRKNLLTQGLQIIFLLLILVSLPYSYHRGLDFGELSKSRHLEMKAILISYETQPAEKLRLLHPNVDVVRRGSDIMKNLQYSVFANSR